MSDNSANQKRYAVAAAIAAVGIVIFIGCVLFF